MDINQFDQAPEGEIFRAALAAQDFVTFLDGCLSVGKEEYEKLSEGELSLLKDKILPHRELISSFLSVARG